MTDFNQASTTWDENPGKVRLAADISNSLLRELPVSAVWRVLEAGCGTGLVTLALAPHVAEIVAVDTSSGMLHVLEQKIASLALGNIRPQLGEISDPAVGKGFDLVVSSMMLHHVADVSQLFYEMRRALRPGGLVAIADLEKEDGSFHPDTTGVHHFGFDRSLLRMQLELAGFERVHFAHAANVARGAAEDGPQIYTVFLVLAQKPA